MNKLNLKWVTDTIGEEYKKWGKGDVVTIQAQTGTGKTYFIKNKLVPYMSDYEHMLIVSNRRYLKRQVKIDLLKANGDKIPKNIEDLDKIKTIGNVTLLSYHQVAVMKKAEEEKNDILDLDYFDYIVMDECHWFRQDADFCDKGELAWKELIRKRHIRSVMIYISATMEDTKLMIESAIEHFKKSSFGKYSEVKLWDYTTGNDYSYLDTYYFDKVENMAVHIKNADIKYGKWIVFVTSKKMADTMQEIITNKKVKIITAETKEDDEDLKSILEQSKFKSDVLITTKVLDNGVNISDDTVKNIVIMAWDRVTFIQELGRVRLDIENPYEINLYIPMKCKKAFLTMEKQLGYKDSLVREFEDNKKEFMFKYRDNKNKLPNELFYVKDGQGYVENLLGHAKVLALLSEVRNTLDKWNDKKNKEKEYTFIKEQLSWIGLEDTFNGLYSQILDEYDEEEVDKLEEQLNIIYDKNLVFLTAKDRTPLIETIGIIDKNHSNIKKDELVYVKNINSLNSYLEEVNSEYRIKQFETTRRYEDGTKKKFKSAWKLIK